MNEHTTKAKAIVAKLPKLLRTEIEECFPQGIGVHVEHVEKLVRLGLGERSKPRGPFACDMIVSQLGREVWRILVGAEECSHCGELCSPVPDGHVLNCPKCLRNGCDACMPAGRGCLCPECEDPEVGA